MREKAIVICFMLSMLFAIPTFGFAVIGGPLFWTFLSIMGAFGVVMFALIVVDVVVSW